MYRIISNVAAPIPSIISVVSEDVYEDSCSDDYYKRCNKWRADNHGGKDLLRPNVEKDLLRPGHNNDDYYEDYGEPHNDLHDSPGPVFESKPDVFDPLEYEYEYEPPDDDRVPLPPVVQNGRYKDELRDRHYGWAGQRQPFHKRPVNQGRPPKYRRRQALQRPPRDRLRLQRGKRKVYEPDPGIVFDPQPDVFDKPLFPPPRKKSGTRSPGRLQVNTNVNQNGEEEESKRHKIPLPFDQFRQFLLRDSFSEGGYGNNLMNNQPRFDLGNFKEEMSVNLADERVDADERVEAQLLHPSGAGHYVDECTEKRCREEYLNVCRST